MIRHILFRQAKLFYRKEGKGRAVVILHGLLNSPETLRPLSRTLSRHYTVISLHLPGHGKSETPGYYCSMENMALLVDEVIRNEGFRTCSIIGYSLGGYIGLAYAELFPDKTKGLILSHVLPGKDPAGRIRQRTRLAKVLLKNKATAMRLLLGNPSVNPSPEEFDAAGIHALIKGINHRNNREVIYHYSPVPIFSITGESDQIAPPSQLQFIRRKKSHIRKLTILPGKGHEGFIETQTEAAPDILKFLRLSFRSKR